MENQFKVKAKQWKNTIERKRVSKLFMDGKTIPEIAKECGIKECVIETHIRYELRRLKVASQAKNNGRIDSMILSGDEKA